MAEADPSSSNGSSTTITDLDTDTLAYCASNLNLRDITNMAMSCSYLHRAAYSDAIWLSLYRQEWPHVVPLWPVQASSVRETYLLRHTAVRQFKFADPLGCDISFAGKPPDHILFDKSKVLFSQGSSIRSFLTDEIVDGRIKTATLGNHNARITCMRLLSLSEPSLHRNESGGEENILVTSSCDHFIRLWWKGGSRCFKGHTGPVLSLSDKLLADDSGKLFASGGEDCTVRLWSLNSTGKRGQHALKATLHGHEKAVSLLSVAGHRTSLLVSISKNGKVRVWDTTTASSSIRSSCCVGMSLVPVAPVNMKCHETLVYVAAGSSVVAVDLRTMRRVSLVFQKEKIHSFEVLPSKSLLCTGGAGRAMLWDIRRASDALQVKPAVEMDGHVGPVKLLHMDSYKVVTGGPDDPWVKVWEVDSGMQTNSFISSTGDQLSPGRGCSAMAVDGSRIVTASEDGEDEAMIGFRDFNTAICDVSSNLCEASSPVSKIWRPQLDSESDESDC